MLNATGKACIQQHAAIKRSAHRLSSVDHQHSSKQIFSIPHSFLHQWDVKAGRLIQWEPSPIARLACEKAVACEIAPSHQQHQHLGNYTRLKQQNLPMERLLVVTWQCSGVCDLGAMDQRINRHLRLHDTYSHWLTFNAHSHSSSRKLVDRDSITFTANDYGHSSSNTIINTLLSTPGPDEWDCFRFGIIQRADNYTFYACVDHLHADGYLMPIAWQEFNEEFNQAHNTRQQLQIADNSYLYYCQQQHSRLQQLDQCDPGIQAWIRFLNQNDGAMPQWPGQLWSHQQSPLSRITNAHLMETSDCQNFLMTCRQLNTSFMIGLMGCLAHALHHLSNNNRIHFVTPITTRSSPADWRSMGWFTGLVPISVDAQAKRLDQIVQSCAQSFAEHKTLATIPVDRVFEFMHPSKPVVHANGGGYMFSYGWPMRRGLLKDFILNNGHCFLNQGAAQTINLWTTRSHEGLSISISHPDNNIAEDAINSFAALLRASCLRLAGVSGQDGSRQVAGRSAL